MEVGTAPANLRPILRNRKSKSFAQKAAKRVCENLLGHMLIFVMYSLINTLFSIIILASCIQISNKYRHRNGSKARRINFDGECSIKVITPRPGWKPQRLSTASLDVTPESQAKVKHSEVMNSRKGLLSFFLHSYYLLISGFQMVPTDVYRARMVFGDDDEWEEEKAIVHTTKRKGRRKSIAVPVPRLKIHKPSPAGDSSSTENLYEKCPEITTVVLEQLSPQTRIEKDYYSILEDTVRIENQMKVGDSSTHDTIEDVEQVSHQLSMFQTASSSDTDAKETHNALNSMMLPPTIIAIEQKEGDLELMEDKKIARPIPIDVPGKRKSEMKSLNRLSLHSWLSNTDDAHNSSLERESLTVEVVRSGNGAEKNKAETDSESSVLDIEERLKRNSSSTDCGFFKKKLMSRSLRSQVFALLMVRKSDFVLICLISYLQFQVRNYLHSVKPVLYFNNDIEVIENEERNNKPYEIVQITSKKKKGKTTNKEIREKYEKTSKRKSSSACNFAKRRPRSDSDDVSVVEVESEEILEVEYVRRAQRNVREVTKANMERRNLKTSEQINSEKSSLQGACELTPDERLWYEFACTRRSESYTQLWADALQPMKAEQWMGDTSVVKETRRFISRWKKRIFTDDTIHMLKGKKKKHFDLDDSDYNEEDGELQMENPLILCGPTGIGKTALVSDSICVNCSNGIASFFSPISKVTSSSEEKKQTLIVVDHVDIAFEEDKDFFSTIKGLAKEAKVYILISLSSLNTNKFAIVGILNSNYISGLNDHFTENNITLFVYCFCFTVPIRDDYVQHLSDTIDSVRESLANGALLNEISCDYLPFLAIIDKSEIEKSKESRRSN
uniref:ATPase_AAA_core domain-containing protein n=1 Tax=Heterorhabditis bacteriophora TaxID=37862 RepID=A0A1I7XG49_HETBA